MENQVLDDELFNEFGSQDIETVQEINNLKNRLNDDIINVRYARNALAVLAVLTFLGTLLGMFYYNFGTYDALIEGFITISIYIGCIIGIRYNARASILTALIFYVLLWLVYILISPAYIIKGIILKAVIIYFLAKGLNSAIKLNRGLNKLRTLGVPMEEITNAKKLERLPRTFTNASANK